ncbi:MAG: methyltransferase domain-containing protein [Desulfovibrio sp.]|nr:methyltransferase domain-containing protein [Desulfovibrio sp.]
MMHFPLENLENDSSGFMRSAVLAAMAELDVATMVLRCDNAATATQCASACSCDARAMQTLLDALVALGYFSKSGIGATAIYAVVAPYASLLDSRESESYIPMLRHRAHLQRHWSRLSWAVKNGTPQKESTSSFLGATQDSITFISAMNAIALRLAETTMKALDKAKVFDSLPPDMHMLDIGGASGTYTEAFLRKLPQATATLFDLPVGIAQAKKRFVDSDMEARVVLMEGDFTKTDFPDGFDFAWISAIIHQMGQEACRDLYRKTLAALKPGGMIAIRDFVMDDNKTSPEAGALFGINMLLCTAQGRVYAFDEIRTDLMSIGFDRVEHAVNVPTMSAVVTALKPCS